MCRVSNPIVCVCVCSYSFFLYISNIIICFMTSMIIYMIYSSIYDRNHNNSHNDSRLYKFNSEIDP